MSSIRVFLKWCGSIEAVPADLYEKVFVPRVRPPEERREETLEAETAQAILDHLQRFKYASSERAVFGLLWETGIRIGAAHSLDERCVVLLIAGEGEIVVPDDEHGLEMPRLDRGAVRKGTATVGSVS